MRGHLLCLATGLVGCLAIGFLGAQAANAGTIRVAADGSGDYPTIQAGIDAAHDGDVVQLDSGVYRGDGNRDVRFLGKRIIVESATGDPDLVIIDCEGTQASQHRGFILEDSEPLGTTLRGITITNGVMLGDGAAAFGGAIHCGSGSSLRLESCIIRNCEARGGGGVYARAMNLEVVACLFLENEAIGGGAIAAIFSHGIVVSHSRFVNNSGLGYAGGILVSASASGIVEDCLFYRNHSVRAAALFSEGGTSLEVRSCTLVDNRAPLGSALASGYAGDPPISSSHIIMERSIVAFNGPGAATDCNDGSDLVISCSDVFGNPGGDWTNCIEGQEAGNISKDPLFCDVTADDFTLSEGSPCLPKGNECGIMMGSERTGCPESPTLRQTWGEIKQRYASGR